MLPEKISLDESQAYAIKQGQGYLKPEQFKWVFKMSEDAKITQEEVAKVNKYLLEEIGTSVRMMTEEDWNKWPREWKSQSYTNFISKSKWVEGYRFYNPKIDNGAILTRRGIVTFWQCDVEKWDRIKGDALEYVLALRATESWLKKFHELFPEPSIFVHMSKIDDYFGVKFDENENYANGKNVHGEILTRFHTLTYEEIQSRKAELEQKHFSSK